MNFAFFIYKEECQNKHILKQYKRNYYAVLNKLNLFNSLQGQSLPKVLLSKLIIILKIIYLKELLDTIKSFKIKLHKTEKKEGKISQL